MILRIGHLPQAPGSLNGSSSKTRLVPSERRRRPGTKCRRPGSELHAQVPRNHQAMRNIPVW